MTIDEWIERFKTIGNFDVVDVNECAELINYLEELKCRRERDAERLNDREEFMNIVYNELNNDVDNNRANRIIDAADEYAGV